MKYIYVIYSIEVYCPHAIMTTTFNLKNIY